MGTDDLFHKRNKDLKRKLAIRNAKPRILIVCEGKKTEYNYFKAFPISSVEIKVQGDGFNTKSLVKFARTEAIKAKRDKSPYCQIWCVFDRDSFSKEDFNAAIQMAESSDFKVAFSNESFEVWYLLHFEFLNTGIARAQYKDKLSKHLGKEYKKNCFDMYECLLKQQDTAIKNAKKLFDVHHGSSPADRTPSTTVHLLVEELNKLISS